MSRSGKEKIFRDCINFYLLKDWGNEIFHSSSFLLVDIIYHIGSRLLQKVFESVAMLVQDVWWQVKNIRGLINSNRSERDYEDQRI